MPEPCPDRVLIIDRDCPTAGTPLDEGEYPRYPLQRCDGAGVCEDAIQWTREIDGQIWLGATCRDEMPALPDTGAYDGPWVTIEGEICLPPT